MDRPTCLSCVYHARNPQRLGEPGECRAPGRLQSAIVGMDQSRPGEPKPVVFAWFPTTPIDLWCGDHPKMDEYVESLKKKNTLDDDGNGQQTLSIAVGNPPSKIHTGK